jgi:hypothetical protein
VILVDTGFWLALVARADRKHTAAVAALAKVREPLITTWPVLTETCHLLANRVGVAAERAFLDSAQAGAFQIFALSESHLPRLSELMAKYEDLPMDLADASLVVLAEELGTGRILSTDTRDFRTYCWKNKKPFKNLLAS